MMMEWYDRLQADVRSDSRRAGGEAAFTSAVIVGPVMGIVGAVAVLAASQPVLLAPMPIEAPSERVQIGAFEGR